MCSYHAHARPWLHNHPFSNLHLLDCKFCWLQTTGDSKQVEPCIPSWPPYLTQ